MRFNKLMILGCLLVLSITGCRKETVTETKPSVEATTEADLDIRISVPEKSIQQEIIIGEDGEVLTETEIEIMHSEEAEIIKEQASIAVEEGWETEPISTETISYDEMQAIEDGIDDMVKQGTMDMMRISAKTEVARNKERGIVEFQNITDEMIDNYSDEELDSLMGLIYKHLEY